MSRRHRVQLGLPDDPHLIKMWCTNRGRHSPCQVGVLADLADLSNPDTVRRIKAEDYYRHQGSAVVVGPDGGAVPAATYHRLPDAPQPTRPDGGFTFTFRCPRCGRAPQIRDDRLRAVLDRWREAGRPRLDLSYWD